MPSTRRSRFGRRPTAVGDQFGLERASLEGAGRYALASRGWVVAGVGPVRGPVPTVFATLGWFSRSGGAVVVGSGEGTPFAVGVGIRTGRPYPRIL